MRGINNLHSGECYIGEYLREMKISYDNTEQSKMEVQNVDLAWFAGIIDGEGCFCIFTNHRGNGAILPSISANLTITNSNCLLLNRCREILDALGIKYLYQDPKNGHQRGRRVMRVKIQNYSSLRRLIELTLPYFVGKAEQAKLVLEFASLAGQKGKLHFDARTEMMNKNKLLNQRGHLVA